MSKLLLVEGSVIEERKLRSEPGKQADLGCILSIGLGPVVSKTLYGLAI